MSSGWKLVMQVSEFCRSFQIIQTFVAENAWALFVRFATAQNNLSNVAVGLLYLYVLPSTNDLFSGFGS
jgi:hypothetical protein